MYVLVCTAGRALEVFCRLSETEAIDYDRIKEVL